MSMITSGERMSSRMERLLGSEFARVFEDAGEALAQMPVSKPSDETYGELMARMVAEGELTDLSLSPVARYEIEFGDIPLDAKLLDFDLTQHRMEIANDPANRAECLASPYFQDLFDEDGELRTWASWLLSWDGVNNVDDWL